MVEITDGDQKQFKNHYRPTEKQQKSKGGATGEVKLTDSQWVEDMAAFTPGKTLSDAIQALAT